MSQSTYLELGHRQDSKKTVDYKESIFTVRYESILIILLGFFMGQAQIAGFFSLSLIFLTIITERTFKVYFISALMVFFGLVQSGDILNIIYFAAAIIGFAIYHQLKKKIDQVDIALINVCLYIIFAFVKNYYNDLLFIHYFITIGEALLIYIISYVGLRGVRQLLDRQYNLTKLSLLAIFFFSSGFLIGLSNISIVPYQIINVLVYIFLISLANTIGFNYSIMAAVLYGLVLINAGVIPMINIFSYIIVSFSCSIFRKKNKFWTIIGVSISILLYSGLSPTIYNLSNTAMELGIALVLFLIIPLKYWLYLYSSFLLSKEASDNKSFKGDNNGLKQHMSEISQVFNELSVTFKETLPPESAHRSIDDFSFIFRSKVCGKCKRYNICWHQDKDDTYKRIYLLLKAGKDKGYLSIDNIITIFEKRCPYIRQLTASVKVSFEIHQINDFWRNRLKDKQEIVSEQLAGIGEIIDQFSEESSLTVTNDTIMEQIKQKASESDIDLYNIELHSNVKTNTNYFTVEMEHCSGNCPCQGQLLDLINSEYECNYRIIDKKCGSKIKDRPCQIVYGPLGQYKVSLSKVMKACSGNISGDSFLYKGLKDGKDLFVISDGMGIGEKAAVESRAAINLLESIIDAGFDQKLAIKTINSALYLRNQDESFTTLDICIFDTFTAKMTFSKIGAVASYVKRDWDLIKVDSASLPAGILDKIEVYTSEMNLKTGDFVIMYTDGMLDIRDDIEDKEEWIRQILQNSSFDKTEDMLDYILDVVLDFKGKISDDMTIVVIKIEEVSKKRRKFKGLPRNNIGERV